MSKPTASLRLATGCLLALAACGTRSLHDAHDDANDDATDGAAGATAGSGGTAPPTGVGGAGGLPSVAVPPPSDGAFDASVADDGPPSGVDAADAAREAPVSAVDAPLESARRSYRALAVTTGRYHTCVLLDDHRVKCWGYNDYGNLGYGDTRRRGASPNEMGDALPTIDLGTGRTATAISAGRYETCAILDDGSLKCWGFGPLLGLPVIPGNRDRGDQPGEMGDALPALDLGKGRKATAVVVGYYGACAFLDDGTARCWDQGGPDPSLPMPYALPTTSPLLALAPAQAGALALFLDGTVADVPPGDPSRALLSPSEHAIAVGGASTTECAVLTGGVLRCNTGPLTNPLNIFSSTPPTGLRLVGISVTEEGPMCGLLQDGSVRCQAGPSSDCTADWCDDGTDGTIGVKLGQPAVAIATGAFIHRCALLADGNVRCWGGNLHGDPYSALGSSFDPIVQGGEVVGFGPFHDIDLGTRP